MARLIGPPLGGLITGLLGVSVIVLLDSATFLIACALIACLTVSGRAVRSEESDTEETSAAQAELAINDNPWKKVWRECWMVYA